MSVGKTVALSLRHSCRSELTRQGISLNCVTRRTDRLMRRGVNISVTLCMSPCSSDYIFSNKLFVGIWHIVSEDSSRNRSETSGAEAPSILPPLLWSFLLIVCTRHIFTRSSRSRSAGYSDFPANSQILLRLANTNLRTVIVTAAVHRGFSSKLHLAVDLSL